MNKDNNQLEEAYGGLGYSRDMDHFRDLESPFQRSGINRNLNNQLKKPDAVHQCGHRLNSWQGLVYRQILLGRDAIVSVPPAAGKTMPLTCAWKKLFVDFLQGRRRKIPRIAVVVPTTQLAMQIGKQDFLRDSSSGLLKMMADNPHEFQQFLPNLQLTNTNNTSIHRDPRTGQQLNMRAPGGRIVTGVDPRTGKLIGPIRETPMIKDDLRKLTSREIDNLYRMLDGDFLAILYGGSPSKIRPSSTRLLGQVKPIVVGTYEPMQGLLKKYSRDFDIVVIDEAQQFIGRPGEKTMGADLVKKQEAFVNIIKNTHKNASLLLLTGSTNDQTVEDMKDLFNSVFNRKLVKFPNKIPGKDISKDSNPTKYKEVDTKSRNRSNISIMPYDKMQNLSDINKLCVDIIKQNKKNTIMLLFSIKRSAAMGILRVMEELILKLPPSNTDLYSIVTRVNDKTGTVSTGINNVDDYDASRKDNRFTTAQLADRDSKDFISMDADPTINDGSVNVNEIEFLKYFDVKALEGGNRGSILDKPDLNNILYQGVLRGMGIMTGSMHQRHKETIQKLFKSGKIPLLFASDALGVGANVKCRYLYIPKLLKFEGDRGMQLPLDQSSLVQLVNRAGRGSFDSAVVYCSSNDFENVKKMIEEDPRTAVDEINPIPMGNLKEYAKKVGNRSAVNYALKLFSST
ncbi:MAG: hypothetical protein H8D97_00860 [Proteobacteria bacterium]|nr:hypothetical protein [Pseudomonadota bacterium]